MPICLNANWIKRFDWSKVQKLKYFKLINNNLLINTQIFIISIQLIHLWSLCIEFNITNWALESTHYLFDFHWPLAKCCQVGNHLFWNSCIRFLMERNASVSVEMQNLKGRKHLFFFCFVSSSSCKPFSRLTFKWKIWLHVRETKLLCNILWLLLKWWFWNSCFIIVKKGLKFERIEIWMDWNLKGLKFERIEIWKDWNWKGWKLKRMEIWKDGNLEGLKFERIEIWKNWNLKGLKFVKFEIWKDWKILEYTTSP